MYAYVHEYTIILSRVGWPFQQGCRPAGEEQNDMNHQPCGNTNIMMLIICITLVHVVQSSDALLWPVICFYNAHTP